MRLINSEELKAKLDRGDDVKLVMTLNEWAYRTKHIPGSIYVASQEQAQELLHLDDEIIVYCTSPACSASIVAYEALRAQGFTNIARYAGGIQAWEEAGYPVAGEYQTENQEEIKAMLEFIGLIAITGGLYVGIRWLARRLDTWLVSIIDGATTR